MTSAAQERGGWRHRDHTRGSLLVSLGVLALPLLATSASQVAFQLVDLGFVSRLGEDVVTAVIVTNQSFRQVLFMLVMGASFGAQALVARAIGGGHSDDADHVAGQVLVLGAAVSVIVAVGGVLAAEPLLRFMNVSPGVLEAGVPYVRLVFLLSFGFVFGFLMNAVLQGAGDSTTPMIISFIQTVVVLGSEWVLIFGKLGFPELGITGVAWGGLVGQAVGLWLGWRALSSGRSRVHIRGRHLRPDAAQLRRIVALAWPPALHMISGFAVTVYFLRLVGDFGAKAQAAYSIGLRLSMVGPMLAFPIAGAVATLVGQNLGAGDVRRAWRSIGTGLIVHVTLLWSVAAALFLFREPIVRSFADDPEVIRIGTELLGYQSAAFLAWAFYFVFLRSLQGAGDVRVPMLLSFANAFLLSIPLGTWLATPLGLDRGPTGIFQATVVSAWFITLTTGAWLATGRWARRER